MTSIASTIPAPGGFGLDSRPGASSGSRFDETFGQLMNDVSDDGSRRSVESSQSDQTGREGSNGSDAQLENTDVEHEGDRRDVEVDSDTVADRSTTDDEPDKVDDRPDQVAHAGHTSGQSSSEAGAAGAGAPAEGASEAVEAGPTNSNADVESFGQSVEPAVEGTEVVEGETPAIETERVELERAATDDQGDDQVLKGSRDALAENGAEAAPIESGDPTAPDPVGHTVDEGSLDKGSGPTRSLIDRALAELDARRSTSVEGQTKPDQTPAVTAQGVEVALASIANPNADGSPVDGSSIDMTETSPGVVEPTMPGRASTGVEGSNTDDPSVVDLLNADGVAVESGPVEGEVSGFDGFEASTSEPTLPDAGVSDAAIDAALDAAADMVNQPTASGPNLARFGVEASTSGLTRTAARVVEQVLEAVDRASSMVPPRSVTLDLEEQHGIRIRVVTEAGGVSVSVDDAGAGLADANRWQRDLTDLLDKRKQGNNGGFEAAAESAGATATTSSRSQSIPTIRTLTSVAAGSGSFDGRL